MTQSKEAKVLNEVLCYASPAAMIKSPHGLSVVAVFCLAEREQFEPALNSVISAYFGLSSSQGKNAGNPLWIAEYFNKAKAEIRL